MQDLSTFTACFVGLAIFCALVLIGLGLAWLNRPAVIERGRSRLDTLEEQCQPRLTHDGGLSYRTRGAGGHS